MTKPNRAERRMPVRTVVIRHTGDYEGWEATVRINPPMRIWEEIESGDYERVKQGMSEIVIAWNYVDEAGDPLKPPKDGGLMELPVDLLRALIEGFRAAVNEAAAAPKA